MPTSKPTALKIVTATGRDVVGHRKVNKQEPQAERVVELPPPPSHFDETAKAHYLKFGELFISTQVLTIADLTALEKLAWETARLEEIQARLGVDDLVAINLKTAIPHMNPEFRIYMDLSGSVDRGLKQFGGTPASRATVKVDKPLAKDDWSDF